MTPASFKCRQWLVSAAVGQFFECMVVFLGTLFEKE